MEELQNTIDKITKIMTRVGALDIYGHTHTTAERQQCQGVLNKAYSDLMNLRKHLLCVQKRKKNEQQ